MRVVVGLGNPGAAYAGHRHTVGFVVIEELARRWRLPLGTRRRGVRMVQGMIGTASVVLAEPQLYMNRTGAALRGIAQLTSASDLIVIHDDLDLDAGRVRVKCGGGTAGHRGLESIVAEYGDQFTRVRVGVGRPPHGADAAEYVLSRFEPDEQPLIAEAVQRAADAVECVLREGEAAAMNRFNVRSSRATTPRDT
jgi:PTH1 family peptidyl-tRNA hydrolase